MTDEKIIEEAKERFAYAQEAWAPIFAEMKDDLRFSDPTNPQQWPEAVRRAREMSEDGPRPCLTFDRTNQFIYQVTNDARQNMPSMKFLPVDDKSDPKLADVLQDLGRQTEYQSRAQVAYMSAFDYAARCGLGFFRVVTEVENQETNEQCAKIKKVKAPFMVLLDPDFEEPDGSDARWGFVVDTVPRKRFEQDFPKAKLVDWDSQGWYGKDHVRLGEYYRVTETTESRLILRDGRSMTEDEFWQLPDASQIALLDPPMSRPVTKRKVEWFKMTGEEILEKTEFPAEYIPLIPVIGAEMWDEDRRSFAGLVRRAKDPQRSYNYERSSFIETVALAPKAPYLAAAEAIEGHEGRWGRANTSNQAYLPWNAMDESGNPLPKPERVMPAQPAAGWMAAGQQSVGDMQAAFGMFEANLGAPSNETSGKAILARQREGDTATFHFTDNLALSIAHCGRILTQVWPRIYDTQRVLRVLGEDGDATFVTVDPEQQQGYTERRTPQGGKQIIINPSVGKYDVRVTTGPGYTTRRQEAAQTMAELVNGNPEIFSILGDKWVQMQDWPGAEDIAKRLKAMLPEPIKQAEQDEGDPAQMAQQLQGQNQQLLQQVEMMSQALQEADSQVQQLEAKSATEIEKERIKAQTAIEVAHINADAKRDVEELKGMVAQLLQLMAPPPPELTQEVSEDLSEDS